MKPQVRELRKAVVHIKYEVEMLSYAERKLKNNLTNEDKNSFIEVFLLHARCLFEFLYTEKKGKNSDDIICRYFLTKKQQELFKPKKIGFDKTRVNKRLAHLTFERVKFENDLNEDWQISEIYIGLMEAYNLFLEKMDEESNEWFH